MNIHPDLLEILIRYGPAGPLKNRVLCLLAMDSSEACIVEPDLQVLTQVCRTKRATTEQVMRELVEEGWLDPVDNGAWQVNPFPACARGARVVGGSRVPALSLVKNRLGTTGLVPTGSTLKVSPVSPTLAVRTTVGQRDCSECGGTGWVDTADGSVKGCSCRGQEEALQGTQPSEHPSAEGHAPTEGSGT